MLTQAEMRGGPSLRPAEAGASGGRGDCANALLRDWEIRPTARPLLQIHPDTTVDNVYSKVDDEEMSERDKNIALVAVNARYSHASLGMRYLKANLGSLRRQAVLQEFTLQDTPALMVDKILACYPAVVAIGVYIWNRIQVEELVALLKAAHPDLRIILGGPEISYDAESDLAGKADCIICGEAELVFEDICRAFLESESVTEIVTAPQPDLEKIVFPYSEYTEADIEARTIYVETSRGCVYGCEYCISSINPGIRRFDLDKLLPEFEKLIERGARRFKFVDRSFNLLESHACAVLDFFIQRWKTEMCLHLEMTPDRLTESIRERLMKFPAGGLHIEVGIQTFSFEVARRVGRNMDIDAACEGVEFLVNQAKADVHADLIAGLPGETPAEFEAGVDRLVALKPAEIQVGILKRLHGAPIARHADEWGMRFRSVPPYEVFATSTMDEDYLKGIRRFSMHWDRVVNRKWFPGTMTLFLANARSPFDVFNRFSLKLADQLGLSGFSMLDAARILLDFMVQELGIDADEVRAALRRDYIADGRRLCPPGFLEQRA